MPRTKNPGQTFSGTISFHPRGFAFLRPQPSGSKTPPSDLFVPPSVADRLRALGAVSGDLVRTAVGPGRNAADHVATEPVRLLPTPPTECVVCVRTQGANAFADFLSGDRPSLPLRGDIKNGTFALVRLDRSDPAHPKVTLIKALDKAFNAQVSAAEALAQFAIPTIFSAEALAAAEDVPDHISIEDRRERRDITALPLVTIDGTTTKDFDDAVCCEDRPQGGWTMTVAIADVAHYVPENGALDSDARLRGTSVYLPGRTVPMLPVRLSNGLCSLNPNVDRLCMVATVELSAAGSVLSCSFDNAVMRSHARLTYDRVARYLVDEIGVSKDIGAAREGLDRYAAALLPSGKLQPLQDEPLSPAVAASLRSASAAFEALVQARYERGALEFDSPDISFIQDDTGAIVKIIPEVRNVAHRLIEEFMIAANVAAAQTLEDAKHPTLFRVHDLHQDISRQTAMNQTLRRFGFTPVSVPPSPSEIALTLRAIAAHPQAAVLRDAIRRTQGTAVYDSNNIGHFGLALHSYAHFTSPIRRYPDLVVHRALKGLILGSKPVYSEAALHTLGESCSSAERRSTKAERLTKDRQRLAWLSAHQGEPLTGVVDGVTATGLFLIVGPALASVLLRRESLGGARFDGEAAWILTNGQELRAGSEVDITVTQVDIVAGKAEAIPRGTWCPAASFQETHRSHRAPVSR